MKDGAVKRSLYKLCTYKTMTFVLLASIAYSRTKSITQALAWGGADTLLKSICYFVHEQAWTHIPKFLGRSA